MNPARRPRWRLATGACLLALAGLLVAAPASAALRLQAESTGSAADDAASRALLAEALRRLPPALAGWDADIRLRWRDDLPAHVAGRARGGVVGLDRALLDGWMGRGDALDTRIDATGAGPGPDDASRRAALAALLHELVHVYDLRHGRLSRDPRLLDLAGWQVQPLRLGLRTPRNAFSARSPDRYELESPLEFVAVNLEHFLLDAEYGCRRPALHAYFAAHFDWSPPAADCAPGVAYVDAGAVLDAGARPLLELDPARVYQVDYLLADHGESVVSRWGHAMLRLVVCAPGRTPGPDCRLDLQHHRVLSFRAFVDDLQVSSWRGLTGSYPSRLFVLPLDQVVDEYTRVEQRGLWSIPLRLRRGEVRDLLERAARVHWSYDGRYRFVGNNCAVETWKLLHDGVPRLASARLSSITPTGLLRKLRRAGLADDDAVPADHAEALRLGYRFDSMATHYDAMFEVARASLALPQRDAADWMALDPERRAPSLARADLRTSAALLLLEQAAMRRQEALARDELKRRYFGRAADAGPGATTPAGDVGDAGPMLAEALREGGLLASPSSLIAMPGYGLPQQEERAQALRESTARTARLRELDAALRHEARTWLPPALRASLEGTEANLATLGDRLRALRVE